MVDILFILLNYLLFTESDQEISNYLNKKIYIIIEFIIQHHRIFLGDKITLKTRRPSHRILRVTISHAKSSYTRLVKKCVIPTFTQAKKESCRDLLREGSAVNGLKDESLERDLARQITIEQIPDCL